MQSTLTDSYYQHTQRKVLALWVLALVTLVLGLATLSIGSITMTPSQVVSALLGRGDPLVQTALYQNRLPRLLSAILVGASLASSGAVMQCVLRNPLASASTLGVSQGAAFGAALGIVVFGGGMVSSASATSSIAISNPYIVTLCAFFFGSLSTLVILAISRWKRDMGPGALVLAGVALSSLFGGGSTLLQYFTDETKLGAIVFWTFGNLGSANWQELSLLAVLLLVALGFFLFHRWDYNAMAGGTALAESLGIQTRRVLLSSMCVCSLLSAVSVSFVGIISFVGLIAPHILQRFVGSDYRYLVPGSALAGALLLILADAASRLIIPPVILPIGALTAFLGAPMFLYLMFRGGNRRG